jgi:hypothetical protein
MRDILFANEATPKPVDLRIPLPPETKLTHVIFGRIYYKDIFGDHWYSTWEHRLEPLENWVAYALAANAEVHQCDSEDWQKSPT